MPIHVLNGLPDYDAPLNGVGFNPALLDSIGKGLTTATNIVGSGLDMASKYKNEAAQRRLLAQRTTADQRIAEANARRAAAEAKMADAQTRMMLAQSQQVPMASNGGGGGNKKMLIIGAGIAALALVAVLLMKKK